MKSGRFNGNVVTYISAAMAVMMITGQTGITTYATGEAEGTEADSGLAATVSGVSQNITTCGWDNWSTYETEAFTLTDEMTDLTIAFSGHINSSYWGDIDNVRLYTVNNSSNEGSDDGSDQNDTPDETENNQNNEEDTQMDNQEPVQDETADINDAQPSQQTVVNDEKAPTAKVQSESEVVKVTKVKLNKKRRPLRYEGITLACRL